MLLFFIYRYGFDWAILGSLGLELVAIGEGCISRFFLSFVFGEEEGEEASAYKSNSPSLKGGKIQKYMLKFR